jgi:hypothetical protein
MPRLLPLLAVLLALPVQAGDPPLSPPVDLTHLPFVDGETLTYGISWLNLNAAVGTFRAHDAGDHWDFHLDLASDGAVNEIYPFKAFFWSEAPKTPPWRSIEYGAFRFEPKYVLREEFHIDYAKHQGTRERWSTNETKTFPIAEDAVDDVGTLLYHLRCGPWQPGDQRLLHIYENDSEKEATATCEARETRAFGTWPAQPLLKITVLPGKGTHRKGRLTWWMTDDAHCLPLHADLEFIYGTFSIDLVKSEIVHPGK